MMTSPTPANPWLLSARRRRWYQWAGFGLRHIFWWLTLIVILAGGAWWVAAQAAVDSGSARVKIDRQNIFVSDNAHLLRADTKALIKQTNLTLAKRADHPQLLVVTVNSLPAGESIERFTNDLANQLGVGDQAHDSGVVYLLAKRQRQARLEVGYGMEATIPDAMTDQITDDQVKNAYRSGDYDAGIRLVTTRIAHLIETGDVGQTSLRRSPTTVQSASLRAQSWLLTTTIGQIVVIVIAGLLLYGCYRLMCWGRKLRGRIAVDQLWRHFGQDLQQVEPKLTAEAALAEVPDPAVKAAIATMQAQQQASGMRRPDYADMAFAFGTTTPETVLANSVGVQSGFRITSMYREHWAQWFAPHELGMNLLSRPKADLAPKEVGAIAPNLLSAGQKIGIQLLGWLLRQLLWVIIAGWLLWQLAHTPSYGITFISRLVSVLSQWTAAAESVLAWFNGPYALLVIAGTILGLLVLWWVVNSWYSIGALLRQRVRLDAMMRHFLHDLRAIDAHLASDDLALARQLDAQAPNASLSQAKAALKAKHQQDHGKKHPRPDYMDMAFAFGSVTNAAFLISSLDPKSLAKTSMVLAHRDDWYPPHDNGSGGGTSGGGSSSGGGSFGGGGFGGGGGTSSW